MVLNACLCRYENKLQELTQGVTAAQASADAARTQLHAAESKEKSAAAADTAARLKQAFEQRVLELNEQIEKQKRHEQECVAQPLAARAHCVMLTLVLQVRAVAEGEGA